MTQARTHNGYTIMEIMMVMILLGALMTTTITSLNSGVNRGKNLEAENMLYAVFMAQQDYRRDNGGFTASVGDLDITIPTPMKHFTLVAIHNGGSVGCVTTSLGEFRSLDANPVYDLHVGTDGAVYCEVGDNCTHASCEKMGYWPYPIWPYEGPGGEGRMS